MDNDVCYESKTECNGPNDCQTTDAEVASEFCCNAGFKTTDGTGDDLIAACGTEYRYVFEAWESDGARCRATLQAVSSANADVRRDIENFIYADEEGCCDYGLTEACTTDIVEYQVINR